MLQRCPRDIIISCLIWTDWRTLFCCKYHCTVKKKFTTNWCVVWSLETGNKSNPNIINSTTLSRYMACNMKSHDTLQSWRNNNRFGTVCFIGSCKRKHNGFSFNPTHFLTAWHDWLKAAQTLRYDWVIVCTRTRISQSYPRRRDFMVCYRHSHQSGTMKSAHAHKRAAAVV